MDCKETEVLTAFQYEIDTRYVYQKNSSCLTFVALDVTYRQSLSRVITNAFVQSEGIVMGWGFPSVYHASCFTCIHCAMDGSPAELKDVFSSRTYSSHCLKLATVGVDERSVDLKAIAPSLLGAATLETRQCECVCICVYVLRECIFDKSCRGSVSSKCSVDAIPDCG